MPPCAAVFSSSERSNATPGEKPWLGISISRRCSASGNIENVANDCPRRTGGPACPCPAGRRSNAAHLQKICGFAFVIVVFPSLIFCARAKDAESKLYACPVCWRHGKLRTRRCVFVLSIRTGGEFGALDGTRLRRCANAADVAANACAEAVFGGFFGIQNRAAMLADGDSGLHFFAARGAFVHAHRHVRP